MTQSKPILILGTKMKLGRQKDSMNGEPFRFTIFDAVHQPLMSTMKLSFKL